MFLNTVFENTVTVKANETFDGCSFVVRGQSRKGETPGIQVLDGDVTIKNCHFENAGYSAIHYKTQGKLVIENNEIVCQDVKNPIEGYYGDKTGLCGELVIKGNKFVGKCGNNYINLYQFQDGAHIVVEDNLFDCADIEAEIIRISNTTSAKDVVIDVNDLTYTWDKGEAGDYTSLLMFQDDKPAGECEDYTGVTFNLKNIKCNGEVLGADGIPAAGKLYFMYRKYNGGLIEEQDANFPVVNVL